MSSLLSLLGTGVSRNIKCYFQECINRGTKSFTKTYTEKSTLTVLLRPHMCSVRKEKDMEGTSATPGPDDHSVFDWVLSSRYEKGHQSPRVSLWYEVFSTPLCPTTTKKKNKRTFPSLSQKTGFLIFTDLAISIRRFIFRCIDSPSFWSSLSCTRFPTWTSHTPKTRLKIYLFLLIVAKGHLT